MENIIFLFGVPRSGSTLLQRILASHLDVKSVAEPWLLLPLLTPFNIEHNLSSYSHIALEKAIDDLSAEHPSLHDDYDAYVRSFICDTYNQLRKNKRYFLDKTPRYYLIASKLRSVFYQSKFIYLTRNPIDVIDSTLKSFCNNHIYRLPYYYYDLTDGLNHLNASIRDGSANQLLVRYEDLCQFPEKEVRRIFEFLDLDYSSAVLTDFFSKEFSGSYGDPNRHEYNAIEPHSSDAPLSYFRKRLYISILNNIDDDALNLGGFAKDSLIRHVKNRKKANLIIQVVDFYEVILFKVLMFVGWVAIYRILGNKRFSKNKFVS